MIFITRAKKLCKPYKNPALIPLPFLAAKPQQCWGLVSGSRGTCSGGCSLGVPLQNEPGGGSSWQPSPSSGQAFPLLDQREGAALHSDIFLELLTSHRNPWHGMSGKSEGWSIKPALKQPKISCVKHRQLPVRMFYFCDMLQPKILMAAFEGLLQGRAFFPPFLKWRSCSLGRLRYTGLGGSSCCLSEPSAVSAQWFSQTPRHSCR